MVETITKDASGIICLKCGNELDEGEKLCKECGEKYHLCPKCGHQLKNRLKPCKNCGNKQQFMFYN